MRGDDPFVMLKQRVADLESELRQSQQAERVARQRAQLLEESARLAWAFRGWENQSPRSGTLKPGG
jgi:hypothetical protein